LQTFETCVSEHSAGTIRLKLLAAVFPMSPQYLGFCAMFPYTIYKGQIFNPSGAVALPFLAVTA
jgi:hypothetical protein